MHSTSIKGSVPFIDFAAENPSNSRMQAIHIAKDSTKKLIQMRFEGHQLILTENSHLPFSSLSLSQLKLQFGGNNDSLLYFEHPSLQGEVLYMEANRKNMAELKGHPFMDKLIRSQRKKWTDFFDFNFYLVSSIVLFLAFFIYFRGPIFGASVQLIPFSVEKSVGDKIFNPKLSPQQLIVLEKMNSLLQTIQFPKGQFTPPITFHISSETVPNAYATVGGHVFINKGLIILIENPEDLLGIVGHELIHVQKRHVSKSILQSIGLYAVLSLFFGDITGISAVLLDQGGPLLNLQYSRELEEEADTQGINLLLANQINPEGLARGLELIHQESQKLISQSPGSEVLEKLQKIELLNSHPETEKRIARLKELTSQQNKTFKKINFDYAEFKQLVKESF